MRLFVLDSKIKFLSSEAKRSRLSKIKKENNHFHFILISFVITQKVNCYEMQMIGKKLMPSSLLR